MAPNYQYRARFAPIIGLILVVSSSLVSCNAHEKAASFISNTVRDQVDKFNNNTNMKVCNPIQTLEQMIKVPTVTEIL